MPFLRLRLHYAYIVTAITFLALLASAGLRSAPAVMLQPLQLYFGWGRSTISLGAAIGIVLYGFVGPFAATFMQRFGIRRTMILGLILMATSTALSLGMTQVWQFLVTWGVLSGVGSGAVASVLGAAIVNRWFATRQGLVMGILSASTATGSLIFMPLLAWLASRGAWQPVAVAVTIGCACLIPFVWIFVPEHPHTIGLGRIGASDADRVVDAGESDGLIGALGMLALAVRNKTFWLLFSTFFICGMTTNGLVQTHMIAYCGDNGIAPVAAAGLLSLMGAFDLIGTTGSGWLSDRYDPRKLLVIYYGLRGISLVAVPLMGFNGGALTVFAVLFGLDWIATVPPTLKIANQEFGQKRAPIVFGWIVVGHQLGAATAALSAGIVRDKTGTYGPAFIVAGLIGLVAALLFFVSARSAKHQAIAHPLQQDCTAAPDMLHGEAKGVAHGRQLAQ
jgi:sugar phosphate permease